MAWTRKLQRKIPKRNNGTNRHSSISKKLRKEGKITEEFEIMLASLKLEEIIGLKLELSSKLAGGKLYGLPVWGSLHNVCQDAVLRYTISASRSNNDAARYLGITRNALRGLYKKFDLDNYFKDPDDE